jgi:hypothetical protein
MTAIGGNRASVKRESVAGSFFFFAEGPREGQNDFREREIRGCTITQSVEQLWRSQLRRSFRLPRQVS